MALFGTIVTMCVGAVAGHAQPSLGNPAWRSLYFAGAASAPPLSYFEGGRSEGIDAELVQALGRDRAFEATLVLGDWPTVVESVRSGELDVLSGVIKPAEGLPGLAFSLPYLVDEYLVFSRKDGEIDGLEDLPRARIAVMRGSPVIGSYLLPNGLGGSLLETSSLEESLDLVAKASVDCAIAPYGRAQYLLDSGGLENLVAIGRPLCSAEYRLAVRTENAELLFLLNEGILSLWERGVVAEIRSHFHFYDRFGTATIDLPAPIYLVAAAGVLSLSAASTLWAVAARRQIRRSTAELAAENAWLVSILDALPMRLLWKDRELSARGSNKAWRDAPALVDESDPEGQIVDRHVLAGQGRTLSVPENTSKPVLSRRLPLRGKDGRIIGVLRFDEDRPEEAAHMEALDRLSSELAEERRLARQRLITDEASGLFSRAEMDRRLEEAILEQRRHGLSLSALMLDFPDFSSPVSVLDVPDRNAAIRTAAEVFRSRLRDADLTGRLSPGVFLAILPRTGREEADRLAAAVLSALGAARPVGGSPRFRIACLEYRGQGREAFLSSLEAELGPAHPDLGA